MVEFLNSQLVLDSGRVFATTNFIEDIVHKSKTLAQNSTSQSQSTSQMDESVILDVRVDTTAVKASDIEAYERLMNGMNIGFRSNSGSKLPTPYSGVGLPTKHHWLFKENGMHSVNIEFERGTPLISMTLDLQFDITDLNSIPEFHEEEHKGGGSIEIA